MGLTRHQVESILQRLEPNESLLRLGPLGPELAKKIGFKTVCYKVVCATSLAIALVPVREVPEDRPLTAADLAEPPPGYPSATVRSLSSNYIGAQYGKPVFLTGPVLPDPETLRTGGPMAKPVGSAVFLKPSLGAATVAEALPEGVLMSESQIVLVPHLGDQILNTRLLADELRVAVEVEREEGEWFSKESLCKAVKCVMGGDSEEGGRVKKKP
ncbi:UDP-Glycosyltransferase superfamily protein [Actinidia rufa]|uniref:UDP-Glycosyltransferase superfamily protein n=1 Tax=Actinidia rufa TaxID=165716 RepID=A0A7J0DEB4_9ERIC|nr:UDP-Glycosyltransferase superfamily protein [Actinidia rufa]